MSVSNGRQFLSIPGPTTVPDAVLSAMHRPAVDIRKGELVDITNRLKEDLKMITRSSGTPFIYIANGHGAWEAALTNVLSRGDKVLVLESGSFAVGWGDAGNMLGLNIEVLPGTYHKAVDPALLEARLRADTKGEIKAVLVVQVDTASSVMNDISALRRAIDNVGHGALFMVDTIASTKRSNVTKRQICAPPTGTGPPARQANITGAMPGRRLCTTCSGCRNHSI